MLFPHMSFVLEVIGACLLLVMIIYAVQLNRRLTRLQADKAHLQKMVVSFNQATERAEASVGRLRASAVQASDSLKANTKLAKELRSDLSFLIERAETMANRLEGSIDAGRAQDKETPLRSAEISDFRPANRSGKDAAANGAAPAKAALSRALAGLR